MEEQSYALFEKRLFGGSVRQIKIDFYSMQNTLKVEKIIVYTHNALWTFILLTLIFLTTNFVLTPIFLLNVTYFWDPTFFGTIALGYVLYGGTVPAGCVLSGGTVPPFI